MFKLLRWQVNGTEVNQHSTSAYKSEHLIPTRKSVKKYVVFSINYTHNHLLFETHNPKSPFEAVFKILSKFCSISDKLKTDEVSYGSEDSEQTNVCRE